MHMFYQGKLYPTEKSTTKDSQKMEYTTEVADQWRQTQQKEEIALYHISSAGF